MSSRSWNQLTELDHYASFCLQWIQCIFGNGKKHVMIPATNFPRQLHQWTRPINIARAADPPLVFEDRFFMAFLGYSWKWWVCRWLPCGLFLLESITVIILVSVYGAFWCWLMQRFQNTTHHLNQMEIHRIKAYRSDRDIGKKYFP